MRKMHQTVLLSYSLGVMVIRKKRIVHACGAKAQAPTILCSNIKVMPGVTPSSTTMGYPTESSSHGEPRQHATNLAG
jgi:hypothetical protein